MTYKQNQMRKAYGQYLMSKKAEAKQLHLIKTAASFIFRSRAKRMQKAASFGVSESELTLLANAARGILREKTANQGSYQLLDNTLNELGQVKQAAYYILNSRR